MKKRLFAATLACLMLLAFSGSAFAESKAIQPYAYGTVEGGLTPQGGGKYTLWGAIKGMPDDSMSIRAELRSSSGAYITETSKSGKGPTITASKTVNLASGAYTIYLYGVTSTHTPSTSFTVTI
jgi:hypothetical protein